MRLAIFRCTHRGTQTSGYVASATAKRHSTEADALLIGLLLLASMAELSHKRINHLWFWKFSDTILYFVIFMTTKYEGLVVAGPILGPVKGSQHRGSTAKTSACDGSPRPSP